jgi:periplasmic copper chaperone A
VTRAPDGFHIMLEGLKKPLRVGQSSPLTLTFEKAGARTVNAAVQNVGAMAPMPGMRH